MSNTFALRVESPCGSMTKAHVSINATATFNPTSVLSVPLCSIALGLASNGAFLRNFR